MRDALSLTDQAISYAAGSVTLDAVQGMLGALDQTFLIKILDALAEQDGAALLAVADQMATRSLSYKAALQDLATLLHQLSIAQLVPAGIAADLPERAEIIRLAALFEPEQIQLFYQIAVHGRNELGLAPDEYAGFSMTLLRMLAFRPLSNDSTAMLSAPPAKAAGNISSQARAAVAAKPTAVASTAPPVAASPVRSAPAMVTDAAVSNNATAPKLSPAMAALEALTGRRGAGRSPAASAAVPAAAPASVPAVPAPTPPSSTPPWEELDQAEFSSAAEKKTELIAQPEIGRENPPEKAIAENVMPPAFVPPELPPPPLVEGVMQVDGNLWDGHWPDLSAKLPLRGVAQQLALQSELLGCEVTPQAINLTLRVPLETLLTAGSADKLATALGELFTLPVKITTEIGAVQRTAHAAAVVDRAVRQDAAEVAIKSDPLVQNLLRDFGATIVAGSIRPI